MSLLADLGRSNEDNGTKHTWVRVLPVCNLCGYWLVVREVVVQDDTNHHELATPQHMHDASYVDTGNVDAMLIVGCGMSGAYVG